MNYKALGKIPSEDLIKEIEQSQHYIRGSFMNMEPTSLNPENASFFKILGSWLNKPKSTTPSEELPYIETDLKSLKAEKPIVVWFGHSSYFLRIGDFKILVDPVFSGNAAPVNFFAKAFPGADNYSAEDFPEIDLLVLTHDHYDHLDYETIKNLHFKVHKIVTSLGVSSHLEYWGVSASKITELDWWQENQVSENVKITATPSRHFSGRGLNRLKTFWSSFVLEINDYRIFIGGDSGYDHQFYEIGERFGSFDIAFLECGQYGKYWPNIHMFPEQTVKAAQDLNTDLLFPVHWAKFQLSTHPWDEPIKRMTREAHKKGLKYVSPKIGQVFTLGEDFQQEEWWNL